MFGHSSKNQKINCIDPIIAQVQKNFESIKKEQDGFEFWSARELPEVIEKAKDFALAMTDHNI